MCITYGLLADIVESIGCGVNNLALNLVCPTAVVPQAAGTSANITLSHGDGLSIVQ